MALLVVTILAVFFWVVNPSLVGGFSVLLIVFLMWLGKREPLAVNPYYLFVSTPFSLLLYSDSVSKVFLPSMDTYVQFLIVIGNFSFLAGLISGKSVSLARQTAAGPKYSFYLILFLGLFPHILGFLVAGFPLFSSDVTATRATYAIPFFGQFGVFLPVAIIIAFQRRSVPLIVLSVALNLFLSVMTVSKFFILFSFLFFLYAYIRFDGKSLFKFRPWQLVAVGFISIPFMFAFVFSARDTNSQSIYAWRQELRFGSSFLDQFGDFTYLPYMYLTSPWSNFAYLAEVPTNLSYGARSLHSIAAVFQFDSLFDYPPPEVRNEVFNTHSYISVFYLDFGIFGVLIMPFVLGLMVKWAYVRSQASFDALTAGIWVAFAFATFNLFFSNHFTGTGYPVVALVLFTSYRFVRKFTVGSQRNRRSLHHVR